MLRSIKELEKKKQKLEEHRLLSEKYRRETNDPYYRKYSNACKKVISRYEEQITWRHLLLNVIILALIMIAMFGFVAATKNEGSATGHVVDIRDLVSDTKTVIALIAVVVLVILTIAILAALGQKKAAAIVLIIFVLALAGFVLLGPFEPSTEEDIMSGAQRAVARVDERVTRLETQISEARAREDNQRLAELEAQLAQERARSQNLQRQVSDLQRAVSAGDTQRIIFIEKEIKDTAGGFNWNNLLWVLILLLLIGGGWFGYRKWIRKYKFEERERRLFRNLEEAITHKERVLRSLKENALLLPPETGDPAWYYSEENVKRLKIIVQDFIENEHINTSIRTLCRDAVNLHNAKHEQINSWYSFLKKLGLKRPQFEDILKILDELARLHEDMIRLVEDEMRMQQSYNGLFSTLRKFYVTRRVKPNENWRNKILEFADRINIERYKNLLREIQEKERDFESKIELIEQVLEKYGEVAKLYKEAVKWKENTLRQKKLWERDKSIKTPDERTEIDNALQEVLENISKFIEDVLDYYTDWPPVQSKYDRLYTEWERIKKLIIDKEVKDLTSKRPGHSLE